MRTAPSRIDLIVLLLMLSLSAPLKSESPRPGPPPNRRGTAIVYVNREYGFRFYLPKSWKGYSVIVKKTDGDFAKVNPAFITIRHPLWTRQNPYEDIPIMVFAADAWPKIADGTVSVSAAPFPPQELGRNRKYVLALPPRYNYDFSTGWEEVDKIIKSKPLQGFG